MTEQEKIINFIKAEYCYHDPASDEQPPCEPDEQKLVQYLLDRDYVLGEDKDWHVHPAKQEWIIQLHEKMHILYLQLMWPDKYGDVAFDRGIEGEDNGNEGQA